jgi:hypothetical protein
MPQWRTIRFNNNLYFGMSDSISGHNDYKKKGFIKTIIIYIMPQWRTNKNNTTRQRVYTVLKTGVGRVITEKTYHIFIYKHNE